MTLLLLLQLAVLPAPAQSVAPTSTAEPVVQHGRTYTEWFYHGQFDSLWDRFSPELRQVFENVDGLDAFRSKVQKAAGQEVERLDERLIPWLGSTIYVRTARFSESPTPVWVQWTMDAAGIVRAFTVQPATPEAPSKHLDYETKTPLRLPFEGEWFVFWGGRTTIENYHAESRDQRFAADLVIARDGRTHAPDARTNEDYFCFGAPVLAPAAGTIVEAVDDVRDNVPGTMNEAQPLGNHVVLDHGNGEYSFLVHLEQGSVAVEKGSKVSAGTTLGRCGNSGRSSEPHLHYHLQTTPTFQEGAGLPAQFIDYCADGKRVSRGELRRGQTVSPDGCGEGR